MYNEKVLGDSRIMKEGLQYPRKLEKNWA